MGFNPLQQPGVDGTMNSRDASICRFARKGQPRRFWRKCLQARPSCSIHHSGPRVEAASAIVAGSRGVRRYPAYGINTGFGKLASKRIPPDQTALLQRNLMRVALLRVRAA